MNSYINSNSSSNKSSNNRNNSNNSNNNNNSNNSNKLSNLIIKKILQHFLIGKYDINQYESYKIEQLSNQYSMKFKDNNIDKIIRLSLVCKLWAKTIIPQLDYPFYHIIGHETLIPPIIRFGLSNEMYEFSNQIELERLSLIVSDFYHKNIIAKAESDALSLLWRTQPNSRGYQPLCYHLGFLSYGFDEYFKLVINKINETAYFFSNLRNVTIKIETQNEMIALRKLLYQIPTIESLNIIFHFNNTTTIPTQLVKTEGLCKSIETHQSISRLSLSRHSFYLPFQCINKFKEINFRDIIILDSNNIIDNSNNTSTTTTTTTATPTNIFDEFEDVNRNPVESLSKLINNNLDTLKRITLRNFSFENDTDNSNHIFEVNNILRILSRSKVLEYLDFKVNEIPYQLIRELLQQCKSLKVLNIKSINQNIEYSLDNNNSSGSDNNSNEEDIDIVYLNNDSDINSNNNSTNNSSNNSQLIEYSFISSKPNRPILPISQSIQYLNVPNLTRSIIKSPTILNNLLCIVHDGSQTKDFNYLIDLINNTTTLEKLVIKSIKPLSKDQQIKQKQQLGSINNSNNINNSSSSGGIIINNWLALFESISNNKTLTTLHLLECASLSVELMDQFIESQHPTIENIKIHNTNFTSSKFLTNHTFKFVNIAIDVSDLTQILIKNNTIKQLKITLTDYKISASSLEILSKALNISKVPSIQLNRSFVFRSPHLLNYFKKYSNPIV